jgi:putative tricarboxylic transport membrane protein
MNRKYWDLASGVGILALAFALYVGSTRVRTLDVSRFGSGFFPAVVAALLAVLGLVILADGIRQAWRPAAKAAAGDGKSRAWGVAATFGLMAAYAGLLPPVGFIIMTTAYLFLQMLILAPPDKRKILPFAVISALVSTIVYYTFVTVFHLMLPAGILG